MARKLQKSKSVDLSKLDYYVLEKAERAVDDTRYFGIIMLQAAPVGHIAEAMTRAEFDANKQPTKLIAHHIMLMGLN